MAADITYEYVNDVTDVVIDDAASNPFKIYLFDLYKPVAKQALDLMITSSYSDDIYNYMWALMVCHLYTLKSKRPESDTTITSRTIGSYSESRTANGKTKYLMQIETILGGGSASNPEGFTYVSPSVVRISDETMEPVPQPDEDVRIPTAGGS